jgi:PAS domain-containing protein
MIILIIGLVVGTGILLLYTVRERYRYNVVRKQQGFSNMENLPKSEMFFQKINEQREAMALLKAGIQEVLKYSEPKQQNLQDSILLRTLQSALDSTQNLGLTISSLRTNKILYVNEFDAYQHGYSVDELLGKNVGIYAPQFLHERSWTPQRYHYIATTLNITKTGSIFPVYLHITLNRELQCKIVFCEPLRQLTLCEQLSLTEDNTLVIMINGDDWLWANQNIYTLLGIKQGIPLTLDAIFREDSHRLLNTIIWEDPHPKQYVLVGKTRDVFVYFSCFRGPTRRFFIGRPVRAE